MKRLILLSLVAGLWSCGEYQDYEELKLNLQQIYSTQTPSLNYELVGGDFTQGLVRLYKVIPPYGERQLVDGSEVILAKTAGKMGSFTFRSPLKEGAYLVRSSVVASRAGTVTERLGSAREDYFSVALNTNLAPKPPVLSLRTDWYSGFLGVKLEHPQYLPEWWNNPYRFFYTSTASLATEPGEPDPFMSPSWNDQSTTQFFNLGGTAVKELWLKAKTMYSPTGLVSVLTASLTHSFTMDIQSLTDGASQDFLNGASLDKSSPPGRLYLKTSFGDPPDYHRLLIRLINVANFNAVELYNGDFYSEPAPGVEPLSVDFAVDKEELSRLSTWSNGSMATNCLLVVALENYGYAVRGINVVE